jgi:hypothetical protein
MSALQTILQDRPIAYHPILAKAFGGVTSGVFLSQLCYWSSRGADDDGWIWKTQEEWEEETGLTRREQDTARRKLEEAEVLKVERRGLPARLYYRLEWAVLEAVLGGQQDAQKRQTGLAESAKQDAQKRLTINRNSETTTETTTETPVFFTDVQKTGSSVDVSTKTSPKPPVEWEAPDFWKPLMTLKGYRHRAYGKDSEAFRLQCEEACVSPAAAIENFAEFYRLNRARYGWSNPVAACRNNLAKSIGQLLRAVDRPPAVDGRVMAMAPGETWAPPGVKNYGKDGNRGRGETQHNFGQKYDFFHGTPWAGEADIPEVEVGDDEELPIIPGTYEWVQEQKRLKEVSSDAKK